MRHCVPAAGRHLAAPSGRRRGGCLAALGVALLAVVSAVLVLTRPGVPPAPATLAPAPEPVVAAPTPTLVPAAGILADWDRQRARAYAEADLAQLRALHVPGSASGRVDLRMLRAYAVRGLRVQDARMEVAEVVERVRRPGLLRVAVVERLGPAYAVSADGRRLDLPRDSWRERVLTFRHDGTRWRLASARQAPEVTPAARPAGPRRPRGGGR